MFRLCLKIPLNVVGINLITLFTFIFSIARFENNAERTRAGISINSFPADYLAGLGFSFSSGWKQGGFPDLIKNIAFGGGGQEGNLWLWDCVRDSLNERIMHLQGAIRVFVSRRAHDRAASEEAALAAEEAASAAAQRRADDAAAKAELAEARAWPPRHRPSLRALRLFSEVRSCGMRA